MSPATRREALGAGLFTGLAAVAAVAVARPERIDRAAAAPASTDAELIAACERFLAIERDRRATYDGPCWPDDHPEEQRLEAIRDAFDAEQCAIMDRLQHMPATTLAGFQAQARMLRSFWPELESLGGPDGYRSDRLAWLLVRGLTAGGS